MLGGEPLKSWAMGEKELAILMVKDLKTMVPCLIRMPAVFTFLWAGIPFCTTVLTGFMST